MEKFIKLNCFKSVMVVITSTPTVTIRITPNGSSGYALLIKHIGVNEHLQTDLNILEEEFLSRGPRFDGTFESNPGWLTNLLRTLSKQGFATITPTGRVFAEAID